MTTPANRPPTPCPPAQQRCPTANPPSEAADSVENISAPRGTTSTFRPAQRPSTRGPGPKQHIASPRPRRPIRKNNFRNSTCLGIARATGSARDPRYSVEATRLAARSASATLRKDAEIISESSHKQTNEVGPRPHASYRSNRVSPLPLVARPCLEINGVLRTSRQTR